MKIAILGWGSLIWSRRELKIDLKKGKRGWYKRGPFLPIEFARISEAKHGGLYMYERLTLVIFPDYGIDRTKYVRCLYAISKYGNIELAKENLRQREGCKNAKPIGHYIKHTNEVYPDNFQFVDMISSWLNTKNDIDAVIWTNLPPNFHEKAIEGVVTPENVMAYFERLNRHGEATEAKEYFDWAPENINTPIRKALTDKLNELDICSLAPLIKHKGPFDNLIAWAQDSGIESKRKGETVTNEDVMRLLDDYKIELSEEDKKKLANINSDFEKYLEENYGL